MGMVEVASFADYHDAELAAYFLQRHGLNAFAGSTYHGERAGMSVHKRAVDTPVFVDATDEKEARQLLESVIAGAFADADPDRDSRAGLGAALAERVAPSPSYKPSPKWLQLAPLIAIPLLLVLGVVWPLLVRLAS